MHLNISCDNSKADFFSLIVLWVSCGLLNKLLCPTQVFEYLCALTNYLYKATCFVSEMNLKTLCLE